MWGQGGPWQHRGLRLVRTSLRGLWPEGAWWYQAAIAFFSMCGLATFILGVYCTNQGDRDAAWYFFTSGTVMWIGAFVVLGFFIGPITKAKHRR